MEKTLIGVEVVLCHINDILDFGHTKEEHDARLQAILQKLQSAGVTLNPNKCQFGKTELHFLGQLKAAQSIQPDPEKTESTAKITPPKNLKELRRSMGIVNHLGKFSNHLKELTQPLRDFSKNNSWTWDTPQDTTFTHIKEELTLNPES